MKEADFRVYGYRWVMLAVYMLAIAVNQIMWITFAPITKDATVFYGVSDLQIGILSMSFMIVYLIVSIPASWIIDTYGIRAGVGAGVVLTGVFGLLRGLFATDYDLLLIFQIGIAIGQPFLLNSITKVASRWFPLSERATASGLGTLAMYFGILLGMSLTPFLVNGRGIEGTLVLYGTVSIVTAAIFFIFAKERPVTPPCRPDQEERALAIDGMRLLFRNRDFLWLMVIFFIGLGVFNSVTTWIENILSPRGFTAEQAGITGGLMILGGVAGAIIMPLFSDRFRRRIPFIKIALAGATLSLAAREKEGRSWKTHTIAGVVNLSSGLIIWLGYKRTFMDGLENFALNTAITETQIWTQPLKAARDYERYCQSAGQGFETMTSRGDGEWSWSIYPGGFYVRYVF